LEIPLYKVNLSKNFNLLYISFCILHMLKLFSNYWVTWTLYYFLRKFISFIETLNLGASALYMSILTSSIYLGSYSMACIARSKRVMLINLDFIRLKIARMNLKIIFWPLRNIRSQILSVVSYYKPVPRRQIIKLTAKTPNSISIL
jgi:hypothetical protein